MRRSLTALVAALVSLAAAPAAHAVTMTLQSVTVIPTPGSQECCVQGGQAEWTYTKEGQTARRQNANFTGIWDFPMPSTIPEAGVTVPLKVTAQVTASNFAPFMRLDGQMITNGRCGVNENAGSGSECFQRIELGPTLTSAGETKSATYDMKLAPFGGTYVVDVGVSDGPKWKYTYKSDPGPAPTPTPTPTATATPVKKPFVGCRSRKPIAYPAAVNEVRMVAVQPEVMFRKAGTPEDQWCTAEKDTVLQQGDEISTDPDGAATLQFADGSTTVVFDTTQLKIASYFTEGGVTKTEILLAMGRVAAKICKACDASKSDFRIKSPTGTASVRGTQFTVSYDPGGKRMLTSVTEGTVALTDRKGRLTLLPAGKEAITDAKGTGKVAALGKAGRRGGVSPFAALIKVMKIIAKADEACGVEPSPGDATSAKPAKGGWNVAIKVIGKRAGTAKWTVKGSKARARNALAKALVKRCK